MRITGVEQVVFGVPDMEAAKRFCADYGLDLVGEEPGRARFEALDGSGVELRRADDPTLPAAPTPETTVRLTIWGVEDASVLDLIRAELSKDREVTGEDLLISRDDDGLAIGFRVRQRRKYETIAALTNAPGHYLRPVNSTADFDTPGKPLELGHIVFSSNDTARATAFYTDRLGFKITDRFGTDERGGIFSRAASYYDHHSLFFFKGPPAANKFHHLEFHFRDFQQVVVNGTLLSSRGWKTHMGPGRHLSGGNWFWYFDTPFGGYFEVSADMDRIDDNWEPRSLSFGSTRTTWNGMRIGEQG